MQQIIGDPTGTVDVKVLTSKTHIRTGSVSRAGTRDEPLRKSALEAGEKTTVAIISKNRNFTRAAHFFCTFLCRRCFARLQHETS